MSDEEIDSITTLVNLKNELSNSIVGDLVIKLDKNRKSNSSVYFIAFPFNGKTKILMFCDNIFDNE